MKQKYSVILLLVVLLSGFFSPITAYAVSESGNFADVPDDHYEKANLLVALEEELVEIGLSLEIFANTSIDFENLQYQSLLPAEERSERSLPAVTPVVPFEFPKVKQFATRIYGNNPTNDHLCTHLCFIIFMCMIMIAMLGWWVTDFPFVTTLSITPSMTPMLTMPSLEPLREPST